MRLELGVVYDKRKSFYGKAMIEVNNNIIDLYSYNTLVASIRDNNGTKEGIIYGFYSQTTLRHIKEFFKQNDLEIIDKTQMAKNYPIVDTIHDFSFYDKEEIELDEIDR